MIKNRFILSAASFLLGVVITLLLVYIYYEQVLTTIMRFAVRIS